MVPGLQYWYEISAVNARGEGPRSPQQRFLALAIPEPPQATAVAAAAFCVKPVANHFRSVVCFFLGVALQLGVVKISRKLNA